MIKTKNRNTNNLPALIIFLLMLYVFGIPSQAQNRGCESHVKKIIHNELKKFPEMELQDIYKLVYQSTMGSEHAVGDAAAVRKWMHKEIENLKWNYSDELIDTISPGGKTVRVNLRPYLKAGLNPEKLTDAFIKTASEFKGSMEALEKNIKCVLEMIHSNEININKTDAEEYFNSLKRNGYPAVHHSKKYSEKYSPAYRIIAGEYIQTLKKD